jgi:O-antigen/teichoic acid export membrane protein
MKSSRRIDAAVIVGLLLLPLLWFAPQAIGGKTLLPADNLFAFDPWKSYANEFGVGTPHNGLISDLVLENLHWKSFVLENLRAGDPAGTLWSPRIFAGSPFLAAGQSSALYPLSVVFYILPLWLAYGVFTWLQLGIAAACMYLFARVLGLRRIAAILSAIIFAFSGFLIVSVNFTMIIAAAAWLPLLLALVEIIVKKQEARGTGAYSPIPYVVLGASVLAVQIYAGHVEITYYVLMVSGFYAAWRLAGLRLRLQSWQPAVKLAGWLVVMVVLGLALGGAQIIPLYELVTQSFREGSASLQQVRDWAWPSRQIVTFLIPDAFGNPTHHTYFDIWRRTWVPVTQNALGQPLNTIDWGVKNYVEGGNYLGLGALALAVLACFTYLRRRASRHRQHVTLFATLAVLSLLFAFGTPLYAILYYALPGYSQLHSAFRWVFPYTLSLAALAGLGLHALLSGDNAACRMARRIGVLLVLVGAGSLVVVALSLVAPGPFVAIGDRLLAASDLARERAFANGAMAWSYEALRIAQFGLMAVLTGAALWWTGSRGEGHPSTKAPILLARFALPLVVLLDLWMFGHAFNPSVNPKLLEFTPPVISWLQEQQDAEQPWRITTFDADNEKLLNANSVMRYGIEDVRGYDSIIPKQYVAYMQRIHPQGELLYNRIAPIYSHPGGQADYGALDNPLLDLLGVRYVVSTQTIPNAGYTQVYDGEVKVYRNADALPRAFIVDEAVTAGSQEEALDRALLVDLRKTVVIEGFPAQGLPPAASPQVREARLAERKNREIFVDINLSDRGWLVYTDNYFEGWKAYLRPFGAEGEGVDAEGRAIEEQVPIYRANGSFRTVYIPQAGQWTVRFVYSPRSFLLGVYATFLGGITLLLLAGWWAWGRYYKGERSEVGTVAKNSAVQVAMSLVSRGIDFAFAMLRLRILSPAGEGSYAFAINFYSIFEILTRFGLGTLVTRDVALDRSRARTYLTNTVALRSLLWLASVPLMVAVAAFYRVFLDQLTTAELQAIAIFALALFFQNIADAVSSVFNAFEKMEYPAGTSTAVAVGKVALGALVLLPPLDLGFVGLAGVSLVMNLLQVVWLWFLLESKVLGPQERERRRELASPGQPPTIALRGRLDRNLQRHMLREGTPLMLNHLLASVFWRISQFVLRGLPNGAAALGIFSAGVKYLDGLNIIPSYLTLAIFPLMSRYAQAGRGSLVKAYRLALQLLFIVALPIAVFVSFAATPLIRILGGAAYLPDSATVLSVMIWSIPIGFVNSVTQYVLIAVNQQRYLTRAFLIGVAFTAAGNLALVPRYGPVASAALLIPAELALFIPFAWAVRRFIGPMPWVYLLGPPLIAAAANGALVWGLQRLGVSLWLALIAGFIVYVALLLVLGAFRGDEFAVIRNRMRLPGATPAARGE